MFLFKKNWEKESSFINEGKIPLAKCNCKSSVAINYYSHRLLQKSKTSCSTTAFLWDASE